MAGAVAAALLAAATVWVFSLLPGLWVWGAFIGWASYDQSGANRRGFMTSCVCMVFGVVMAWLVALSVAGDILPLPSAAASALAAGIASFIIVYVSVYAPFANVPATFYGFASAFAFLLLKPGTFAVAALSSMDLGNVLICVATSLLIGSILGVIQQQLAMRLTEPPRRSERPRLTPSRNEEL